MPRVRGRTDAHRDLSPPLTDRPVETKGIAQIGVSPLVERPRELDSGLDCDAPALPGLLRGRAGSQPARPLLCGRFLGRDDGLVDKLLLTVLYSPERVFLGVFTEATGSASSNA